MEDVKYKYDLNFTSMFLVMIYLTFLYNRHKKGQSADNPSNQ